MAVEADATTAAIGLDDTALLEVSRNGGAGLFIVDDGLGSAATIDSRHIVFDGNAEGDTVGDVTDVAPSARAPVRSTAVPQVPAAPGGL